MIPRLAQEATAEWITRIREVLAPHLHQIAYGNVRAEVTDWGEQHGIVVNMAIVYEMPGGSTNQINITYFDLSGMFSYLSLDAQEELCTESLDEVAGMVQTAIDNIPDARRRRLCEDIDRWAEGGMRERDLFQQMTKLMQIEDLRGGAITLHEMKVGIAHILAHHRADS